MMNIVILAFGSRLNGPGPKLIGDIPFFDLTYLSRDSSILNNLANGANYVIAVLLNVNFHIWHVVVELQMCVIAPLFLFILWRWGYKAFPILILTVTVSVIYYSMLLLYLVNPDDIDRLCTTRCCPWFIGLLLGYCLYRSKGTKQIFSGVIGVLFLFLTLRGLFYIMKLKVVFADDPFFTPTSHVMWAFLMSGLIYFLYHKNLPVLSHVLSLPLVQTLSKLTYCAYLWHVPLILVTILIQRSPRTENNFIQVQFAIAVGCLSLFIAFPWTLLFEQPVITAFNSRKSCREQKKPKYEFTQFTAA